VSNKPYHHGNLREALIEAGIDLINKEGINQLSLRKVASFCGVSQAAPYSHFQNKEELLESIRSHVLGQFMKVLENAVLPFPNQKDPKILVQIGKSYVMFFINNPQYFSFMFSADFMEINLSIHDDGTNNFPPLQFFKTYAIPILGELDMTDEKAEDAIISMWATVHGLASLATMKNVRYDKSWETKIEDIIWNK
jgi:AcrR family transcriptional regulator